jgi:uncharacterized protein YjiS (DUF1127 family)
MLRNSVETLDVSAIPVAAARGLRHTQRPRLADAVGLVLLWMERGRQRRSLAALDDRQLRDLGLTRADVQLECAKPMWRT